MRHVEKVFLNLMYSGLYNTELDEEAKSRVLFLNLSILIAGFTLTFMAIQSLFLANFNFGAGLQSIDIIMAAVSFGAAFLMVFLLIYLRRNKNRVFISYFMSIALLLFCLVMIYLGSYRNTGYEWIAAYPIMSAMLLGWRGLFLTVILLVASLVMTIFGIGVATADFTTMRLGTIFGVAGVVLAFSIGFELSVSASIRKIKHINQKLQQSNTLNRLIKENGDSVCLIDASLVIQAEYSQSLETLIGDQDLGGKNLIGLFAKHTEDNFELEDFEQYLSLFFQERTKDRQLENLNDYHQVKLYPIQNLPSSKKVIDLNFKRIHYQDTILILCFFKDISEQIRLEQRLTQERLVDDQKLKDLLKIVHLVKRNPVEIEEFLTETETSIDEINLNLKSGKKSNNRKILLDSFVIIHDIKSTAAYVLNIDSITQKFHDLEEEISTVLKLNTDADIESTQLRKTIYSLGDCYEEIQSIRGTLADIFSVSTDGFGGNVFALNLESLVTRLNQKLSMAVRLDLSNLDSANIPKAYKKAVKQSLVQLIRNSFAHGFESAEQRMALAKSEYGQISISSQSSDGKFRIVYRDDGQGLDVDKIRQVALSKPNFAKMDVKDLSDKQLQTLILYSGFSTSESADFNSGRGLGMSIVSRNIKANSGAININSVRGQYCQFALSFPA